MGDYMSSFHMALHNPASVYETPEQVLADPRLDTEGRRAILRSWERKVSGGEGFPTGPPELGRREVVRRIRAALAELDALDRNHAQEFSRGRPGRRNVR